MSPTLVARAADLGLTGPGSAQRGLGEVLPALAGALGMPGLTTSQAALGLPSARRACVVLVDGLGHENLAERAGHAPFLRGLLAGSTPLTSTFPSTTATAMGTFGTGAGPGLTGMLGYTVRDPATGLLGNLVSWTNLPSAQEWQREPTWFETLMSAGVAVTSVGPARFAGSGLSRAALHGAAYRAAERLDERIDAVLDVLRAPGLAYLYWGEVDKVGHHEGWRSWQWGDELAAVDGALAGLARRLPAGTLLLVTADHGMVDVDPAERWDAAADPALSPGVRLVAGEPRALHLHVEPGQAGEVLHRWSDRLAGHALVATREEVVGSGLLGPVAQHVLPVVGDVVVAMAGRATVVDSRTQTAASRALLGVHGSLTTTEMLVPCLVQVV